MILNEKTYRNTRTIYLDAFGMEFLSIWGATKFKNEIEDLCYNRSHTIWMQNNEDSEDKRRSLLYSYMKPMFAYELPTDPLNRYYPILPTDNLALTRIIKNLCNVYNESPERSFNPDKNADEIKKLYENMKVDTVFQNVYRLAKLTNEVIVRPIQKNNKWKIEYFTNDLYRTYRDEFDNLIELWIPFQTLDNKGRIESRFHVWTNEIYYQADGNGNPIKFTYQNNQYVEYPNKYKKIPFTFLRLSDSNIYSGGLFELVKLQLQLNQISYSMMENIVYSGVGIWFGRNLIKDRDSTVRLNPGTMLNVNYSQDEPDPDIQHIAGTPNYLEIEQVRSQLIKSTMKNLGLPSSVIEDKTQLSGVAYKIDRAELNETRKEDISVLESFEQEFLNDFINIYKTELGKDYGTIELNVDYNDVNIQDPKEELEYLKELYAMNIISPLTLIQRLTGNTLIRTNEEAIEFINKNKELKGEINANTTNREPQPTDDTAQTSEGNTINPNRAGDSQERNNNVERID